MSQTDVFLGGHGKYGFLYDKEERTNSDAIIRLNSIKFLRIQKDQKKITKIRKIITNPK